jgi:DNA repair exonuclease SbcCD ATPase subunit
MATTRVTELTLESAKAKELKAGIEEKIKTIAYEPSLTAKLQEENSTVAKTLVLNRTEKETLLVAEARIIAEVIAKEKDIQAQKILATKIKGMEVKVLTCQTVLKLYDRFKLYALAKIRPMVTAMAETLFMQITSNRYANFRLDADYKIFVTTHAGFERSIKSISGSESELADLCLRLALATVSIDEHRAVNFLLLDEISAYFDPERTASTMEGLLSLTNIFSQILNITHKEIEQDYASKVITVAEENGTSSCI